MLGKPMDEDCMLTDRNEASQFIYERIKTCYPILEETYRGLLALR